MVKKEKKRIVVVAWLESSRAALFLEVAPSWKTLLPLAVSTMCNVFKWLEQISSRSLSAVLRITGKSGLVVGLLAVS